MQQPTEKSLRECMNVNMYQQELVVEKKFSNGCMYLKDLAKDTDIGSEIVKT